MKPPEARMKSRILYTKPSITEREVAARPRGGRP